MRAMIVLAVASSPLALAAPADAQSVIQDGRWVTGQPKPAPAPAPPAPPVARVPVEQVAPAPASVPRAEIVTPPPAPATRFAPPAEIVQQLPPAKKPPVARAAAPTPPVSAPPSSPASGEAGAFPPPPSALPVARAEAASPPPVATYAPPARTALPARRVEAKPPPPVPQRPLEAVVDVPPPPRPHVELERRVDARPMTPRHDEGYRPAANRPYPDAGPRWGDMREGRWEGGWRAPGGWGAYRRPARGWSLPRYWAAPEFVVVDYWTYDLDAPVDGHRWVRYYDDAVLVDPYGRVLDWREGVDWNDTGGHYGPDARDDRYYDDYADGYGPDRAPPGGYPAGGYIANGYYYPPAVTHTIRVESEPVVTTRTYVTEEVVTSRVGKGGKGVSRRVQTKACNC